MSSLSSRAFDGSSQRKSAAPLAYRWCYRPWNYPILLSLQPVVGAIAAGCPALLKPSEITPNTASLLAELFPKYLDQSAYRIINGGVPEVTYLLKLKWDHSAYDWDMPALQSVGGMLIACRLFIVSHVHGEWGRSPDCGKGGG